MDNKIIKIDNNLIAKDEQELDEMLNPFSREILLFTTKISNTYRLIDKEPLLHLKVGDLLTFKLGNSKYEDNLIEIYTEQNQLVGYIPEQDSIIFARLMNAGKKLSAKVKTISVSKSVPLFDIDIYLIDF